MTESLHPLNFFYQVSIFYVRFLLDLKAYRIGFCNNAPIHILKYRDTSLNVMWKHTPQKKNLTNIFHYSKYFVVFTHPHDHQPSHCHTLPKKVCHITKYILLKLGTYPTLLECYYFLEVLSILDYKKLYIR